VTIRPLSTSDALALECFLLEHRDTSMILRSNARSAGLLYDGAPMQGVYVAAFEGSAIVGAAAHYHNGMLILQAPTRTAEIARACVEESRRVVTGFLGPTTQVNAARSALGVLDTPVTMDKPEAFYGLDLTELVVPTAPDDIECRAPRNDERDELFAWRVAYDVELLNAPDSAETRDRTARWLERQITQGNAWVAVKDGRLLSLSAFNAALPDIVQLGGIYTPKALRRRGYARIVIAASLLAARDRGVRRAVLFTSNPNAARCYETLGFRREGDYALVIHADAPVR
jgi:RimJ/RimL family protein N-acetyltransferase